MAVKADWAADDKFRAADANAVAADVNAATTKLASLATVATSGSYADLSSKPSIPAAQVNADWNASSGVAQVLNKPTIPPDLPSQSGNAGKVLGTDGSVASWVAQSSGGGGSVQADWDATTGDSVILNKPDVWESLTAIPGFVTADLTMSAGQYAFVDGTQTLTISAPATPAHGDLLGIFLWGSGGSITFDGNGSSVALDGNPTFPLLAPGSTTVTQTTWAFDSGQSCWMVVGFGISPEVASLGGSGETGRALMAAADAAGARTTLGLAAVATSGDYGDLSGKPTIPDVSGKADKTTTVSAGTGLSGGGDLSANRTLSVDYGTAAGTACEGDDGRLSDARTPTDGSVTDAKVAAGAGIALSKLAAGYVQGSVNGTATTTTLWRGTQAQYDAIGTKDDDTVYVIKD